MADLLEWLWPIWDLKNSPIIHIFVVVNIAFFGYIYYHVFFNKGSKNLVVIVCMIAAVITIYFTKNFFTYPSEANTASSIAFIILSLVYFYQLLNRQEFVHIEKLGLFWFNAAVLFYFSINIFLFMLFKRIPQDQLPTVYIINNVTNIIANLLYTIGLLCKPQRTV